MKKTPAEGSRNVRADAQRNVDAILEAARDVFDASGVNAPVREIAAKANVGIATLYRHFPQRSDLVAAVYRREVDACATAAAALAREHEPLLALTKWLARYTSFIATKRGLAATLRSEDPGVDSLPRYFREHLEPALRTLLDAAAATGQIGDDVDAYELLQGVGILSVSTAEHGHRAGRRMIELLIDGLRYRAPRDSTKARRRSTR